MLDMRTLFWRTRPRLKGSIESVQVRGEIAAGLLGSEAAWIATDVWLANVNAQPTTARSWKLEVKTDDGKARDVAPVRREDFWEGTREGNRPQHTTAFPLDAVFPQNFGVRGWLYFPWNAFNGEITQAVLVVTDAQGKQHRIEKA